MKAFANLLDQLIYTRSRNTKLQLISHYLKSTPDPDRGWALAVLTGELSLSEVKPSLIRAMVQDRVDPSLFAMSYDYVGDLAETVALIWSKEGRISGNNAEQDDPSLTSIIETLLALKRADVATVVAALLDALDDNSRFALLKLVTGGLRIGVSARLAKTAFAQAFGLDPDAVEEIWHGVSPPYAPLFAWAEDKGPRPSSDSVPIFRPFMLAHPLEDRNVTLADYAIEWKWDGIRVQIVRVGDETRLYSRAGDNITAAFPEVAKAFQTEGTVDGELMVRGTLQGGTQEEGGGAASFNALQQRLNRKKPTAAIVAEYPAFVRAYDLLFDGKEDLRGLTWTDRRTRLEQFMPKLDPQYFDLSSQLSVESVEALEEMRSTARDVSIEGLMLKRRNSLYVPGRKTGLWFKLKRDPLTADCVMMYAQRGHGKRSSYYSDYTFGCWDEEGALLPVGKAYSGITDEELAMLDKFVRNHTTARFGPVREVEKSLVLEIAFDSLHNSKRHKSGVAMRFPRIKRIRTDKPAAEADQIATLRMMIAPE